MSHRTSSYQDVVSLPTALASRRDLIDTMRAARFVTIEGPIGAGKSVLAREFLRSCSADTRTALIHGGAHPLTRDELWHQAIEALSATRGGPQTVQHRASRRDATSALHEIAHIDDPAVLVFDGIEVCGSPAVHNDLIWLLERNSRLIVVTAARRRTHDPVLTAIAGSVRISADDLKLSGAQSTELLHELGGNSDTTLPPMYAGDVIATHWAIDRGLRELTPDALTAVQLDAALARLGERQRQDVLALSIPADANRELLETICFDVDSMLINAEEAGVLEWTARGGESHWSMPAHLRRVAIRRLAQLNPAGARSKQSLVAHFHYEHGDVLRAWEHAVLARDFDLMTTLLDHHSDALNRGQHDVVISGLESLGATTLVEHPALKLGLAQAYRFAGLHARADSLFARGARRINKKNERLGFAKQLADLGRLSHVYQLSGDFKRAAHTADRIISMISVREDHTLVEAGPGAHAALARAAGSMLATGRYRDAGELAARLSAVAAENGELLYGAIAVQAVVASIDGRISEARRFVGLLDDMHVQDSVRLGLRGFAGEIARALIALDSRDEASARETIDGVAAIIDATPHWPAVSVLHALCALAQDRPDEGLTVMARSASAGSSRAISPAAESYLGFVRALLHLAQGSSAKAAAEIQRAKLHDTGLEALTRLLDNDAADALAIATRVLERRDASERDRLLALSVAGGSAHQMDLEIVAEGFAAEAAECSSAWGLAAPLRWLPADLAEWLASRLASPMQQSRASLFRRGENVHVDLTEREVAVLQAAMHFTTRREIAESLEVSENTVKTQLRTANEKLGTSSRAGAVARAAELGYFLP